MLPEKEIIKAISDLNFWGKEQNTGNFRGAYLDKISKFLASEDALVIIGVRRAGKTYLSKQILKKLIEKGTRPEQTLYVNLEDHKLGPYLSLQLLDEIYFSYKNNVNKENFTYLVLDEIHAVSKWEKWVRGMQERQEDVKIILTGSNSRLLRKEISTVLTGRTITFDIFPLSFREFLDFKNIKVEKGYKIIAKERELRQSLTEYLKFGGFPKVVLEPDEEVKQQTLKELFEGIVNKDIVIRNKIREEHTARIAAELTMANFSRLISANKLRNLLTNISKTRVSPNFVVKLLGLFEDAFLFFHVPIFSYKVKEQKQYPKKTYSIDSGLINAVTTKFTEDYGLVYENTVAVELWRRHDKKNIFYWRNLQQEEVDFIIKEGNQVKELIQVCYNLHDSKKRELRALLKASDELKCNNLIIITGDYEAEEDSKNKKIKYIPLWKWLLDSR